MIGFTEANFPLVIDMPKKKMKGERESGSCEMMKRQDDGSFKKCGKPAVKTIKLNVGTSRFPMIRPYKVCERHLKDLQKDVWTG